MGGVVSGSAGPSAVMLGVALALVAGGCSQPILVIANRSDTPISVGPGLVIPPCDSVEVTVDAYTKAQEEGERLLDGGESWDAPAGTLVWSSWGVAANGPNITSTFVISSRSGPAIHHGRLDATALPPCGGAPAGIEPGTLLDASQ